MSEPQPNGAKLRVRPAVEGDARRLCDFRRQVLVETEFLLQGPEDWIDHIDDERELIGRFAADPGSVLLIAATGGAVVGMCSVVAGALQRNRHVGQVGIGVLRRCWRQGVASALMRRCLTWAQDEVRLHKLSLQVHSSNGPARKLYEDLGFEYEGVLRDEARLGARYVDLLAMGRLLGPAQGQEEFASDDL